MTYDTIIFRGSQDSNNPKLLVTYIYSFNTDEKYPTVKQKRNGGYSIDPSFSISISEGFDKPRIFIPGNKYFAFISLFRKALQLIKENLFTIFPNVTKSEFEVDSRALERFQTEKAMAVAGMTAEPGVWVNETNECFPALRISSKLGSIMIPIEDADPLIEAFTIFDPVVYSVSMLHFFGDFKDNK